MTPASVVLQCLWHLANAGSGRAAGDETKAAAGDVFKPQVPESDGLPVKAATAALCDLIFSVRSALPSLPGAVNVFSNDIFFLLTTK